jgi:serine-type D-Ala-D-Ala carboxypeptidase
VLIHNRGWLRAGHGMRPEVVRGAWLAVWLAVLLPLSACLPGGGSTGEAWADRTWAGLSLRSQAAQLIVAEIPEAIESQEQTEAVVERLQEWLVRDSLGGVLLRGGEAVSVARLLNQLQHRSRVPLLVASPLDRGLGGVVAGAAAFPPLAELVAAADEEALEEAGRVAGEEARTLGVHLALVRAGEPAFPASPGPTAALAGAVAYLRGLQSGGVPAAVSVFAATAEERSGGAPVRTWDRAWLEAWELPLLRQAVADGVAGVLLEPVAVPSLAGDTLPVPYSRAVSAGLLRRDLAFEGLVIADLGGAESAGQAEAAPGVDAVRALAAGADLLLGIRDAAGTLEAIVAAVADGRLPREHVEQASRRVLRAKGAAGLDRTTTRPRRPLASRGALQLADALAAEVAARQPPAAPPAPVLRPGSAAEAGMSEAGLARADAVLRRAVDDGLFPGAALAVARRGVLVRLQGYGLHSRDPGAPRVDGARTLYDLASLTKVLGPTAAAMALVDDGVVELDAPASRYLDGFRGGDRERVTVRQLLAHTGGLPAGLALHGRAASPQDALRQIVGARLVLDPGSVALYSDLSMIVLGEAMAHAADEPLDRLLARRVFRPLGMASTQFLPPLALRPAIAPSMQTGPDEWEMHGIVHDGTAFRLGGIAGHAGLFSTALDVAVFAQTMLNGGSYGAQRVFSPETVATFGQRQPRAQERALGWDTPAPESSAGSYFSERSYGHTGYTGTSLWIDPDKELFVVLLTNRTYDRTSLLRMLDLRQRLHNAVALSITDTPVRRRPGAVDVTPIPQVRPVSLQPARRPAAPPRSPRGRRP